MAYVYGEASNDVIEDDDPREICKYGSDCYQKNPKHHKRFKHLPPSKRAHDGEETMNGSKRVRTNPGDEPTTSAKKSPRRDDDFVVPVGIEDAKDLPDNSGVKTIDDIVLPGSPIPETYRDVTAQSSPENIRLNIEQKFLLDMPNDFFDFWDLCTRLHKEKPEEALQKAGLTLVGPYDILNGKLKNLKNRKISNYVCHWRYYYDPPEFMTVIAGSENELHFGYFRDDPFLLPDFVASMSSIKPGIITPMGGNIFAAVCSYLSQRMKEENPFKKTGLQRLHKEIESYAKMKGYCLDAKTKEMKERNQYVVAKTFHGAGISTYTCDSEAYRESPVSYAELRKMLRKVADSNTEEERIKHFDDIQWLINDVQYAYDEGDYATGIELGINMFIFGSEVFHKAIVHLLGVGYDLMRKEPFVDIIKAHLNNRRRGSNLSILDCPSSHDD